MRRSITRSIATMRRSMRCFWIFSSKRMNAHRARSCWISTTPTFRCTASRRAGSSTATIKSTATCRSTCSAAGTCCWPANGVPTSQAVMARSKRSRIIARIRQEWPRARIILRADSGFCNDELMGWCEANRVDYVFGLARNRRLEAALVDQLAEAKRLCAAWGQPARVFRDFWYCTIDSWNRTRRVVGKAEHTLDGANPRFVVTSLKCTRSTNEARFLYEQLYCARGEAENRVGEQFELFADRSIRCTAQPSATMQANQLRMSFSAMAY